VVGPLQQGSYQRRVCDCRTGLGLQRGKSDTLVFLVVLRLGHQVERECYPRITLVRLVGTEGDSKVYLEGVFERGGGGGEVRMGQ
jgi:hypothetical protein